MDAAATDPVWPDGFERIPREEWVSQPIASLARKYDSVEEHGWYRNLDRTREQLREHLAPGALLMDYSGGTGILAGQLLAELPRLRFGILIADSSPRFLRLAVDKLGSEGRVAFRLIRYLKERKRLELAEEFLDRSVVERGLDGIVSTNAIHLYYDLEDTLRSWTRVLRPGARVFIQSGNIGGVNTEPGQWIIDETVEAIHAAAVRIVHEDDRFAGHRDALASPERMTAYERLRRKYFLPVRPLAHYLGALSGAGLEVEDVEHRPVEARVDEWRDFLAAYHEGVLGWVGGTARIDGREPSEGAVRERLELIGLGVERVFGGATSFSAVWTYITARSPGAA